LYQHVSSVSPITGSQAVPSLKGISLHLGRSRTRANVTQDLGDLYALLELQLRAGEIPESISNDTTLLWIRSWT